MARDGVLPPTFEATIGRPVAIACNSAFGSPSEREGRTNMEKLERMIGISS